VTGATDDEARALRDRCALACLTQIRHIQVAYGEAPAVLERVDVDDRAVDLWSSLVAIASVADAERGRGRTDAVLQAAQEAGDVRAADAEGGTTADLIGVLEAIRQDVGPQLPPAELLAALRARPGRAWVVTTRRMASLLNPLGISRRQAWNGGARQWGYVLDPAQLADLKARYGAEVDWASGGAAGSRS
jgi:hypothetical protein